VYSIWAALTRPDRYKDQEERRGEHHAGGQGAEWGNHNYEVPGHNRECCRQRQRPIPRTGEEYGQEQDNIARPGHGRRQERDHQGERAHRQRVGAPSPHDPGDPREEQGPSG
jgi:hypothetical protein